MTLGVIGLREAVVNHMAEKRATMRRRIFLSGGIAAAVLSTGITRARASESDDMAVLRAAMAIHPGLYRYNSRDGIEDRLARFGTAFGDAASIEQKYLLLSRFLATLRCGHSYCNFFNQTRANVTELFDRQTRLPFHFEWLGTSMVVTRDDSGTDRLPPGTRITAINGVPSEHMLRTLMPYARADGHNDGKRRSLLGVRGAETIEFFDVFQGLLYPPQQGSHVVDATGPDGRHFRAEVPSASLKTRQSTMTRVPEDSDQPRWTWTMRPDSVAVLDMPGWAMWNSKWDWQAWLDARLDSLDGAKGLIIDLRQNEGGDDCGNPILTRLIDRDTVGWDFEERVRFMEVPDALSSHVSTWDDSFRHIGRGGRNLGGGFYERPNPDAALPIRPSGRRLTIPVAALIGPANSSATYAFAVAARATGKVRLFGEQTGGNRRGINGGAFFFTTLPDSGIEFDLPLVGYFPRRPQPDAGLDPDVTIPRTASDIASGHDPVLTAAVDWAKMASTPSPAA